MKLLAGIIILISSLLCVVHCADIEDCGSENGEFTKVSVTNCGEEQKRCVLKRGTNATVTINFKLNTETENEVKAVCFGKLGTIDIPFKLPNPDACTDSGIECPLKKGSLYSYKASFPILKVYPKVNVVVKYELKSSDNKNIVCVLIPVAII